MRITDQEVLEAIEGKTFTFDCRHHYSDKQKKEFEFDRFDVTIGVSVHYSSDLEDIIEKDIYLFEVTEHDGNSYQCDLTSEEVLEEIYIS